MAKKQSNSESFQNYGFVRIVSDGTEKPQSVLRMQVLSAKCKKPSKVKKNLESKNNDCKDKDFTFFERKANCVKRFRMDTSGVLEQPSRASVETFFHASLRMSEDEKPHTMA